MNSDYIEQSKSYAQSAREDYENSLSYLIDGLNETKTLDQEAANVRYQNLITQIRQQIPDIQESFAKNAKAAYINKEQNLQQIDADLSRLGVNTQGFGVTQRLQNNIAYGAQYGELVSDYNKDLRDIANQEVNALGDLNEDLAGIDSDYAKDKLSTLKYIGEQGQDQYNREYNNYYNNLQYQDQLKQQELENQRKEKEYADKLKQQAWENAFKEKQYADQLKQQKFENEMAVKQYNLSKSRLYSSSSGSSSKKGSSSNNGSGSGSSAMLYARRTLNPDQFSSTNAFKYYLALVQKAANDGGISSANLNEYLNKYGKNFTNNDIIKIKNEFVVKTTK